MCTCTSYESRDMFEPLTDKEYRDWALIVPCYLMLVVLLAYFSYAALSAYLTPSFDSPELITGMSSCHFPPCTLIEGMQLTHRQIGTAPFPLESQGRTCITGSSPTLKLSRKLSNCLSISSIGSCTHRASGASEQNTRKKRSSTIIRPSCNIS